MTRLGAFWEEESLSLQATQMQRKQDETASLMKVPSHVANTDKNYVLMQDVRVNKKPGLIGQPVYN